MEQPKSGGGEENNGGEKKDVAEAEKMSSGQEKDPSPNLKADPKPSEANGEQKHEMYEDQKHEKQKEENNSSNIINEGNDTMNDKENNESGSGSNRSASPSNSKSKKSVRWSEDLVTESPRQRPSEDGGSNPYVAYSSVPANNSSSLNIKDTMENVKDVLGRWGRKVGEATRKAEDLAGNTWQHLKTSPSLADAALGRIAQGAKVLAEGGYEKIFRQTFETVPEEQLQYSYACYLSTSAGPVMGILYISTAKLAFSSDNPLSYKNGDKTEWSFYKVVIPLHQLKAVNPSSSRTNSAEKYIQVISVDNHEFWYMGFLNYDGAVKCLQDVLQTCHVGAV